MNDINQIINTIHEMLNKRAISIHLSKVVLNGFSERFDGAELNFNYPLTVLVGKNGSGKTTILRTISVLTDIEHPENIFFETSLDEGGLVDADISYTFDNESIRIVRTRHNNWKYEGELKKSVPIVSIQTKTMIGSVEKSLLFDNIGKRPNRDQNVEYVVKQSRKIFQSKEDETQRKQKIVFSKDEISCVNEILDSNISNIELLRHKFFHGTWGESIIFQTGERNYSEYNAGDGEYRVSCIVNQVQHLPAGSVLLIDEPEMSLHPGAQRRLIEYLLNAIKNKKLQILISTQSETIVDGLPKEAIKVIRKKLSGRICVAEQVSSGEAFIELESRHDKKKHLIVEDSCAKSIIDAILEEEHLNDLLIVEYYPGGASNIKKNIILPYALTKIKDRYFMLDGDQNKGEIPDLNRIPEIDKTLEFYEEKIEEFTGIKSAKYDWSVDGNRNGGRYDEGQKKVMYRDFLDFYKANVFYLPSFTPEDILYNESCLKRFLGMDELPDLSKANSTKGKLKIISDTTGQKMDQIEYQLRYWFIKEKENKKYYKDLLSTLRNIIELK